MRFAVAAEMLGEPIHAVTGRVWWGLRLMSFVPDDQDIHFVEETNLACLGRAVAQVHDESNIRLALGRFPGCRDEPL